MQTAGRLCVVARDNITPLFYSSKEMCVRLISAFRSQEELIERGRQVQTARSMKKNMETMCLNRAKVQNPKLLTRGGYDTLNLVSEDEDKADGGWVMGRYTTNVPNGDMGLDARFVQMVKTGHVKKPSVHHDAFYVKREGMSETEKRTYDGLVECYTENSHTGWINRDRSFDRLKNILGITKTTTLSRVQKVIGYKYRGHNENNKRGLWFQKLKNSWQFKYIQ